MAEPTGDIAFDLGDVVARPYREADAAGLLRAVRESVNSVGRWLPWCTADYGEQHAVDWIRHCGDRWTSGEEFTFAIVDARGEFLGAVGLNHRNREHNFASIGYWIRESARGRALASRVAREVIRFGFDRVRLPRIEIVAAVENVASRRTAERTGARLEGIQRNRLRVREGAVDAAMYAIVPSDLRND
jgi:RimJ/RimL family protein N-acetyltransferase